MADDMRIKTSAYRRRGLPRSAQEWSLDVDSRLEALDCGDRRAYRATLQLLDLEQPPTGIFSALGNNGRRNQGLTPEPDEYRVGVFRRRGVVTSGCCPLGANR